MRLLSMLGIACLAFTASACVAQSGEDVIAETPTAPRDFQCADGRRVSFVSFLGGVSVTIAGLETFMQQIEGTGLSGYVHEGGGLGWRLLPDGTGELADLAPGQSMAQANRIPCPRVPH